MKLKYFTIPYLTDERLEYAKQYLIDKGYFYVDDTESADFVVLPIPVKKYMFDNLEGKTVSYGVGYYKGSDYNKIKAFLLENAFLTSEGAIALYKENSNMSIYNSKVLITGYGRIAQALHKALTALGADVTICSRSKESIALSIFNGAKHIGFDELKVKNNYDIVFNTVPHIIFTKPELDALDDDVTLIDLASFPGGVDTLYASSKGIKLIDGKRLPSRYSKKSAGYLIGKTVHQIIKEDFS
ncbi:MAG: NAD(P)-binding domain-containing protein [Eubacterium sp.]|nr:NAD(P)-binding domain-containing protein [Eubacterium sp.]